MKNAVALALAAVALAGCNTTSDTTAMTTPLATAPMHVTAVGTSPIIRGKQAAFCQDQVAYTYDVKPQYVSTSERVVAAMAAHRSTSQSIRGTRGSRLSNAALTTAIALST